jgi:hypothetical protein
MIIDRGLALYGPIPLTALRACFLISWGIPAREDHSHLRCDVHMYIRHQARFFSFLPCAKAISKNGPGRRYATLFPRSLALVL